MGHDAAWGKCPAREKGATGGGKVVRVSREDQRKEDMVKKEKSPGMAVFGAEGTREKWSPEISE